MSSIASVVETFDPILNVLVFGKVVEVHMCSIDGNYNADDL